MVAKKPRTAAAEEADPIDHDDVLTIAIEKLQQIQDELQKVNEEATEELLEIEQNYMEKRKPLYKRRDEIISEIPEFWLSTFLNHPTLEKLLTEEDQKIFAYLESINVEDLADPRKGYCITFNFKVNPFFKNKKLIKTIKFLDDKTVQSIGTTIHWKAGKGPAGRVAKKGSKRPLPSDSFFNWFSSPDKVEYDNLAVAGIIKEEIWPNPIDHLNNLDDEDDYEDEDEDEDEDEEDGDEDDDDNEDGDGC